MDELHFLQGGSYQRITGIPRPAMCPTCAFRDGSPVRPSDFNAAEFAALCDDLDDFVCHTTDPDGTNPSCAAWHALHKHP